MNALDFIELSNISHCQSGIEQSYQIIVEPTYRGQNKSSIFQLAKSGQCNNPDGAILNIPVFKQGTNALSTMTTTAEFNDQPSQSLQPKSSPRSPLGNCSIRNHTESKTDREYSPSMTSSRSCIGEPLKYLQKHRGDDDNMEPTEKDLLIIPMAHSNIQRDLDSYIEIVKPKKKSFSSTDPSFHILSSLHVNNSSRGRSFNSTPVNKEEGDNMRIDTIIDYGEMLNNCSFYKSFVEKLPQQHPQSTFANYLRPTNNLLTPTIGLAIQRPK